MKLLKVLVLAAVVLLSLTACGGGGGSDQERLPAGTWGESNWSQVRWGP